MGFAGEESELRKIISQGGMHVEMPPWREKLSATELDTLAKYVVDPASVPDGQKLFQQYCSACHGERVPVVKDVAQARDTIAQGGPHQTMPVWGNILTAEQLDALVSYTLNAARGTSTEIGQKLFSTNCAPCHGPFGEGGANPTRPGDIIVPISTAEFLKTRDDFTLKAIIAQGQPNFGMSPFGSSFGGPLSDDEIDAVVAYIRTWETNPPVELPPEVAAVTTQVPLTGTDIYKDLCAQCHGPKGEGGVGPSLSDPKFQDKYTDQQVFDTINNGHKATSMIAWGEVLSSEQIEQLVDYIRQLRETTPSETPAGPPTFTSDILPIFKENCTTCHGSLGGWDATSYQTVMTGGNHGPVVIPGDEKGSLLAKKLLGTQEEGNIMPPRGKLPDDVIQVILDWIAAGAPEN